MKNTTSSIALVGLLSTVLIGGSTTPAQAGQLNAPVAVSSTFVAENFTAGPLVVKATDAKATVANASAAQATNWYGCVGLISAKQWQVLVFAVGYCPSLWVLQNTSWGRSVVKWVVNGLCRSPWVVRAATRGRYSRC